MKSTKLSDPRTKLIQELHAALRNKDKEIKYYRDCLRRAGRTPKPYGYWEYQK